MSRLLARYGWTRGGSNLSGSFLDIMDTFEPSELAKESTGMLAVPGDGDRANHSDFGRPLAGLDKEEVALLGSSRAADMLVNILLPLSLAYADTHGKPHLRTKMQALYVAFPKLAETKSPKPWPTRPSAPASALPPKPLATNRASSTSTASTAKPAAATNAPFQAW